MFKKNRWDKPFSQKVAKRVKMISSAQLPSWIEGASYEITRCIREYEKSGDIVFLNEALIGAEALHASVDELHRRHVV